MKSSFFKKEKEMNRRLVGTARYCACNHTFIFSVHFVSLAYLQSTHLFFAIMSKLRLSFGKLHLQPIEYINLLLYKK